MSVLQEKFKAIADKIREKTETKALIKPNDFANEIDNVYNAGMNKISKALWDGFQHCGKRGDYTKFFYGAWWDSFSFHPQYIIKPTNLYQGFYNSNIEEITQEQLDCSQCKNLIYAFYYMPKLKFLPEIDMKSCNANAQYVFALSPNLETIENIKHPPMQRIVDWFNGCISLKELRITGPLYRAFNIQDAKELSKASIESIIAAASEIDLYGDTITFSKEAVDKAFETSHGANDGSSSNEWLELINTKPNWNISLITT